MSNALKIQRHKAGMTLEDLAARTHIHFTALSKIEHGKRQMRVTELPLLAEALGCSIDVLLASTPDAPHVGHCLREARIRQGLSQVQLATQIGVHWHTIDHYERGLLPIPSPMLAQLTTLLGLPAGADYPYACPCLTMVTTPEEHRPHA